MRELTCDVNGIQLSYTLDGDGPLVVLIHGLACGKRMWHHQIRTLRANYTVLAFDQRGHGNSSAPTSAAEYSPSLLLGDLIGLLDHLQIEKCNLVGFSLGGGPALAFAMGFPSRVSSLILADVGSGADCPDDFKARAHHWAQIGATLGRHALTKEMMASDFFKKFASKSARANYYMKSLISRTPLHALSHTFTEVLAKRLSILSMKSELSALLVPTLSLQGDQDEVCQAAHGFIAQTVPNISQVVLEACGHMTPLESPRNFNTEISRFLAREAF